MILTIYLTLLGISIATIALAYWKEKPFVQIFGYSLLLFLGAVLMNVHSPVPGTDGIQYITGENTTTTYTYAATVLTTTDEIKQDNYATYTNQIYGFLLTITGIFLIGTIVFDPKVKFK